MRAECFGSIRRHRFLSRSRSPSAPPSMWGASRGYANTPRGGVEKNYAKVLNDRRGGRGRRARAVCVLYACTTRACVCAGPPYVEWVTSNGAEGAGFSGRYANKPLPDVSGVRFGLKLLLVSAGIIVVGESLPAARQRRHGEKENDLDYC